MIFEIIIVDPSPITHKQTIVSNLNHFTRVVINNNNCTICKSDSILFGFYSFSACAHLRNVFVYKTYVNYAYKNKYYVYKLL